MLTCMCNIDLSKTKKELFRFQTNASSDKGAAAAEPAAGAAGANASPAARVPTTIRMVLKTRPAAEVAAVAAAAPAAAALAAPASAVCEEKCVWTPNNVFAFLTS